MLKCEREKALDESRVGRGREAYDLTRRHRQVKDTVKQKFQDKALFYQSLEEHRQKGETNAEMLRRSQADLQVPPSRGLRPGARGWGLSAGRASVEAQL